MRLRHDACKQQFSDLNLCPLHPLTLDVSLSYTCSQASLSPAPLSAWWQLPESSGKCQWSSGVVSVCLDPPPVCIVERKTRGRSLTFTPLHFFLTTLHYSATTLHYPTLRSLNGYNEERDNNTILNLHGTQQNKNKRLETCLKPGQRPAASPPTWGSKQVAS